MDNDVIVEVSDKTKEKLRDFDEQEAYFLLLEIFSYAQATKDYAKFQTDLAEWKKRYPIDFFSDALKQKIKYMLSKEFLDTVLKNFIAFDELSKKDPAQGLEKLRAIFNKAEKHKDGKRLDDDLEKLYEEYPLKYLKEKYPHIVPTLTSKAYKAKILEKFDSSSAFKDLQNIIEHPENYYNMNDFKAAIEEWQRLYPTSDFNDKFKPQVTQLLNESLDERKLEELFPVDTELDLDAGEIIPLEVKKSITLISKDALYDFFKIVNVNANDINGLFDWFYKYSKYINTFDTNTKNMIVSSLMTRYSHELPPVGTEYRIPKMESSTYNLLSLSAYNSIGEFKKASVIQFLGILSTGNELTPEDIYRLNIINENVQLANDITSVMKKAKIEPKLDLFMDKFPENKLTPSDDLYLKPTTSVGGGGEVSIQAQEPSSLKTSENDIDVEPIDITLPSVPVISVDEGNEENVNNSEDSLIDKNTQDIVIDPAEEASVPKIITETTIEEDSQEIVIQPAPEESIQGYVIEQPVVKNIQNANLDSTVEESALEEMEKTSLDISDLGEKPTAKKLKNKNKFNEIEERL